MSILTSVFTTEFEAMVKAAYQSSGRLLMGTTRERNNFIGNTVSFPKMNSIEALPTGFNTKLVGQDPGYSAVTVSLQKYTAPTYVDSIEELTVNFDARKEQARLTGMAVGRREDQVKLEALINSGTSNTIADGGTNLTFAKIQEVNAFFDAAAVPMGNRHIAVSASGAQALLGVQQFTDNQYVNKGAIQRGTIDGTNGMGLNFHLIPTMTNTLTATGTSGGLPKTGDIRTCYAWDSESVGYAVGALRTEINYIADYTSWLIAGILFANAVAIDATGIVSIAIDETK